MKFSLILATVGRTGEVAHFLERLCGQTYNDFELLVVDQNSDDRLAPILEPFTGLMNVQRVHSRRGLSRARNVGLERATGDVVAFPDDDCWYPDDLLQRIVEYLEANPHLDGMTGRSVNRQGRSSSARWAPNSGILNRFSLFTRGISITIFLRRRVVERVGNFDETLGLGSGTPWGSGEESDYLIRAVNCGFAVMYLPDILVFHDDNISAHDKRARERAYSYSMGMGRLLRKHSYPWWFVSYNCIRPLGGALLALLKGRSNTLRYYIAVFLGRLAGWTA